MHEVVFTSEAACNSVAGRTVRGMGAASMSAAKLMGDMTTPIAKQLYGARGKMRRGSLKTVVTNLYRTLQAHEAVLDLELETLSGPLSSNESYFLRFVMMMSDEESPWAEFVACEALLTRQRVEMGIIPTDFMIHRHALSRYMQRTGKPLSEFFKEVVQPLRASPIFAQNIMMAAETTNIALAMGSGLLLGKCDSYNTEKGANAPTTLRLVLDADTGTSLDQVPRLTLIEGVRVQTKIMTYADGDLLSENRTRLHARLTEIDQKHAVGTKTVFDTAVSDAKRVRVVQVDELSERANEAIRAVRVLITGPEWRKFEQSVTA